MLGSIAHIGLLELVDDSASDTIDHVDGQGLRIVLVRRGHSKHVRIEELVEKVSLLAEDSWEHTCWLGRRGYRAVLGSDIEDCLAWVKVDLPSVLRGHRLRVETISDKFSISLLHLREVGGTGWRVGKLDV